MVKIGRSIKEEKLSNDSDTYDYKNADCFHRAVYPILIIAQIFALMPLNGICNPDPKKIKFTVKSLGFLLTVSFILCGGGINAGYITSLVDGGLNARNVSGIVFFTCGMSASMLFLNLATKWPDLVNYWSQTELIFLKDPYEIPSTNLSTRVRRAAAIIMILSLLEHASFYMSSIYTYYMQHTLCNTTQHGPTFEHFVRTNYGYVFNILPFQVYLAVIILIINFTFTFVWNYMDLFIMMVSQAIAYRFEQIEVRVNKLSGKEVPEATFTNIREHYVKVCELLDVIDDRLSGIILLSCMNNLYFICHQLLNIFNKLRWPVNYIYFWYSLLFLIGRTAFVFLCAAAINEKSRAPLSVLRECSNATWCSEVERLIYQMSAHSTALSGNKFYYLTRRLLFGMAGTIVTYELVLLQLDAPNRSQKLPGICD